MRFNTISRLVFLGGLLFVSSCSHLSYYKQAVSGQLALLADRRPVTGVLEDPGLKDEVRQQLQLSQNILAFAGELGLPVEKTFSTYVDVGRPYVVWNVFAAEAFSLQLKTHCFPIAGCVGYKGFFAREAAEKYAAELRAEGLEVFVGGVAAYSTLGWFDDPLLSTFIMREEAALAALLFHELAHKVLYIEGDTSFNESFATAIERYALKKWLDRRDQPGRFAAYLAADKRRQSVIALILATRERLALIYASQRPENEMQQQKNEAIADMRQQYQQLKDSWQTGTEFEYWMQTEINNARLGAIGAYHGWVPAFQVMLAKHENLDTFFQEVKALSRLDRSVRDERLASLASSHRHQ